MSAVLGRGRASYLTPAQHPEIRAKLAHRMAPNPRQLSSLAVAALAGLCLALACSDGGNPEVHASHPDSGGSSGSGGNGGKPDSGPDDGATDAMLDATPTDAALSSLRLGIVPVPPSSGDAGPSPLDEKAATLDVIALGSRGVSMVARWDQLFDGPNSPTSAWKKLAGSSQLFKTSGRQLLLCLALVDHTLDARPVSLPANWNDPVSRAAIEALVDEVFSNFGDELYALSFGDELDRYLSLATAKNAADLTALVEHGIDYARKHPARPPALVVGATFSADALVKGGSSNVTQLLADSDVVVATYYPLDAAFKVRPPSTAAQDLDQLIAAVSPTDGDAEAGTTRPILLQEVGYPSALENGSAIEQQRAFYEGLFQALAARRERLPFVSVNGLHDLDAARCSAKAGALGAPGNAAAIAAYCSMGLKTAAGVTKPAFGSVLDALAKFSTP